ncbi:MAG: tRNA 2-selenouridine(34) synthase MnmH [Chitinophagales bacterium]
MAKALQANLFWQQSRKALLIDVRSPAEFLRGHIPGAVNMPLFSNEERAQIGTLYKQAGKREAVEAGLEIVGPKIPSFVQFVKPLVSNNTIYIHCWRGGMRSGSVAWLMETAGYEVFTLSGGYKSFRHFAAVELSKPRPYLILGGPTASAKTPVLHQLQRAGEQVLDLEAIAHHRGSAFGAIAQPDQPTQETFENRLFEKLIDFNSDQPVWVEDESRGIGKCFLPPNFRDQLRQSPLFFIERNKEVRIKEAVRCYGDASKEELIACFEKIERRMGSEAMRKAVQHVHANELEAAVALALHYYDKAYRHSLEQRGNGPVQFLKFEDQDTASIAMALLQHAKKTANRSIETI